MGFILFVEPTKDTYILQALNPIFDNWLGWMIKFMGFPVFGDCEPVVAV